jgi:hypothetical protein
LSLNEQKLEQVVQGSSVRAERGMSTLAAEMRVLAGERA